MGTRGGPISYSSIQGEFILSKIDRVETRIRQIEQRIERGPQINSAAFSRLMADQAKTQAPAPKANHGAAKLDQMGLLNRMNLHSAPGTTNHPDVKPLGQSNSVSCGQTSVAMCLNTITGQNLNDMDIDQNYGFGLLNALKTESRPSGVDWSDAGNISAKSWDLIDKKVNQEGLPVMVALNGYEFSKSGRGHIVTITKTEGDKVTYADPADGTIKTTTKYNMQNAPSHPDGNFVFVANRIDPDAPKADGNIASR